MCKNSFFNAKADVCLDGKKKLVETNVIVYPNSVEVRQGGTFVKVENQLSGEISIIRLCQLNGLANQERKAIERIKKEKYKKRRNKINKKTETCFRR